MENGWVHSTDTREQSGQFRVIVSYLSFWPSTSIGIYLQQLPKRSKAQSSRVLHGAGSGPLANPRSQIEIPSLWSGGQLDETLGYPDGQMSIHLGLPHRRQACRMDVSPAPRVTSGGCDLRFRGADFVVRTMSVFSVLPKQEVDSHLLSGKSELHHHSFIGIR